jgi:hypothetical protein
MSENRDAAWWAEHFDVPHAVWVDASRGTGMPELLLLHQFGRAVYETFGVYPWLVGSALTEREPHDIDVRLVLSAQEFQRYCGAEFGENRPNSPWAWLSTAYALLARQMTGLPVDFQIQTTAHAARYKDGLRVVLGGWFVLGKRVDDSTLLSPDWTGV